jgi:hypothetical protein
MNEPEHSKNFILGNAILAAALLVLLFMGRLWEVMGVGAMVLWTAMVIAGVTLLMKDKGGPSRPS